MRLVAIFISRVCNISTTWYCTRYTCDISSSLKSHSIYASRISIYLSISTCVWMRIHVRVCMYVLVYCDEHLQLAQKVIDFWGCAIRKQWKWNGIFGQNELKCGEGRKRAGEIFWTFQSSTVTFKMPYIYTKYMYTTARVHHTHNTESVYTVQCGE